MLLSLRLCENVCKQSKIKKLLWSFSPNGILQTSKLRSNQIKVKQDWAKIYFNTAKSVCDKASCEEDFV